jgi:hypothetical protein
MKRPKEDGLAKISTSNIASPLRGVRGESAAKKIDAGSKEKEEASSPIYIGSNTTQRMGGAAEGDVPPPYSYVTPVDDPGNGLTYVIALKSNPEDDTWRTKLTTGGYGDLFNTRRCVRLTRTGVALLAIRAEFFTTFQGQLGDILRHLGLQPLCGENNGLMPWCTYATLEDTQGLLSTGTPLTLYLSSKNRFIVEPDERRIVSIRVIGSDMLHKVEVCVRGCSAAITLMERCQHQGLTCAIGVNSVMLRYDLILLECSVSFPDSHAFLAAIGHKFAICRSNGRVKYINHDDMVVYSVGHWDDSGHVMKGTARVLFKGATAHFLKSVLSNATKHVNLGTLKLSLVEPDPVVKTKKNLDDLPDVEAPK